MGRILRPRKVKDALVSEKNNENDQANEADKRVLHVNKKSKRKHTDNELDQDDTVLNTVTEARPVKKRRCKRKSSNVDTISSNNATLKNKTEKKNQPQCEPKDVSNVLVTISKRTNSKATSVKSKRKPNKAGSPKKDEKVQSKYFASTAVIETDEVKGILEAVEGSVSSLSAEKKEEQDEEESSEDEWEEVGGASSLLTHLSRVKQ